MQSTCPGRSVTVPWARERSDLINSDVREARYCLTFERVTASQKLVSYLVFTTSIIKHTPLFPLPQDGVSGHLGVHKQCEEAGNTKHSMSSLVHGLEGEKKKKTKKKKKETECEMIAAETE